MEDNTLRKEEEIGTETAVPKTLEMVAVKSSQIEAVGFDDTTKKLYVKFNNGGSVYSYDDASEELFQDLLNAESVGSFFTQNIKGKTELPHTKMPVDFPHKVLNVTDGENTSPK